MRVAINAQVHPDSGIGGVISALIGLTSALGALDGPEEYVIIGPWQAPDWLRPYLGPNQRIVAGPRPRFDEVKALLGALRPVARAVTRRVRRVLTAAPAVRVPSSDGFYERLGCDVLHFAYQDFVVCGLPSIYNPHDLQHLHYPEFFTAETLAWRAAFYPTGCRLAHTVVVASSWVKDDVVRQYGVDPGKVQVIPFGPPTQAYPEPTAETLARVRRDHRLDGPFALYPAMTWPHKNHLRLLDALALLRDRHRLRVTLVCTGHQNAFWPTIRRRISELRLDDQVRFVGLVPPEDLRALYRLAQFVVVPTLFEAASGPLYEAWHEGVPVTCSDVTSLPEQAGDAALIFDPTSVEAIAAAVGEMATNPTLRDDLRRRGARRLKDFSWARTARAYRAVYRRAAGHTLSEEDQWLLTWDWMRTPAAEPTAARGPR
ncbi:MAG: glycosyltransferase family 1 protein [Armatimonadota bacterium]|nr:glycosyltransferase family 1 protein [Armatimonadota bacterium]